MTTYFRTKITTKISKSYKETYYLGVAADNWDENIANEFFNIWLKEQEDDLHRLNNKYIKIHSPAEECTNHQYKNCYIKLIDF